MKLLIILLYIILSNFAYARAPIILMTDFGLQDGAVSAMKGVILSLDQAAIIVDLTHNIEPFNIQEASYRLKQVMEYYPKGSVFICVVDPGVGTDRRSIVAKLNNGYYFVGPDNGIITNVAKTYGVAEIRVINENIHRLTHDNSFFETFHGRDVFAFVGAKLASGIINFEQIGEISKNKFKEFAINEPEASDNSILGNIDVLDGVYGNLWTNINNDAAKQINLIIGKTALLEIYNESKLVYSSSLKFVQTFGEVKAQQGLVYINSVGNLAIALNQGNFAKKYGIKPSYRLKLKVL